jgi:hypothetical protein
MPNGTFHSFILGKPGALHKGVSPLISGVKGTRKVHALELFSKPAIPSVRVGTYRVICGLVPEGVAPRVSKAIPGFLDREPVEVQ